MILGGQKRTGIRSDFQIPAWFPVDFACGNLTGSSEINPLQLTSEIACLWEEGGQRKLQIMRKTVPQHVHKGPLSSKRKGSPINLWRSPERLSLSLVLISPPSFISNTVISIVNLGSKAANCHLPIHQLIGCRGEREVGKKVKIQPFHSPLHHTTYGFLGSVVGRRGGGIKVTTFPNFFPKWVIGARFL